MTPNYSAELACLNPKSHAGCLCNLAAGHHVVPYTSQSPSSPSWHFQSSFSLGLSVGLQSLSHGPSPYSAAGVSHQQRADKDTVMGSVVQSPQVVHSVPGSHVIFQDHLAVCLRLCLQRDGLRCSSAFGSCSKQAEGNRHGRLLGVRWRLCGTPCKLNCSTSLSLFRVSAGSMPPVCCR